MNRREFMASLAAACAVKCLPAPVVPVFGCDMASGSDCTVIQIVASTKEFMPSPYWHGLPPYVIVTLESAPWRKDADL